MTDDHDWVAGLLAAAGPAPMPDDVAARLDLVLRSAGGATTDARPPLSAATAGASPTAVPPTAGSPTAVPPTAVPPTAVPPTAVPPTAGSSTTGSLPRLRSVPAGSDDDPGAPGAPRDGTPGPSGSSRDLRDDDEGEHRRRLLLRWAPVAAGVLVLGGAGIAALSVLGDGSDGAAESAAGAGADQAAAAQSEAPPRVLVQTGTRYSTLETDRAAFEDQVRELVAVAATDPAGTQASEEASAASGAAGADAGSSAASEGASVETDAAAADPQAARAAADASPLSDPAALAGCVEDVTSGAASTAAAVDLAVVDGVESTVVVVPDAAGLAYEVYVVGPDCSGIDEGQFKFFTVTP